MILLDSVILDIDGTLWDTTDICARAWSEAIKDNTNTGIVLSAEELKGLFGKPMNVIFASVFPMLTKDERDKLSVICCEYEDRFLETEEPVFFDGVTETIKELSERLPVFIVSNCQKGYIETFLRKSNLSENITDYLCYGDTLLPKSGTMRALIEKNALESPIYVGDTLGDEEECGKAGVPFVYAAYGFGEAIKPYFTIKKFPELLKLIDAEY